MTPPNLTLICTVISLLVSFGNLLVLIYTIVQFLGKPGKDRNKSQDEKILVLEKRADCVDNRINKIDERLHTNDIHFKAIDEGNSVIQSALIAIMDTLISGDNKEELKKARNELNAYLTSK